MDKGVHSKKPRLDEVELRDVLLMLYSIDVDERKPGDLFWKGHCQIVEHPTLQGRHFSAQIAVMMDVPHKNILYRAQKAKLVRGETMLRVGKNDPLVFPLRSMDDAHVGLCRQLAEKTTLWSYWGTTLHGEEDHIKMLNRISLLEQNQRTDLLRILSTEPWTLVWREPLFSHFRRISPLSKAAYDKALVEFKVHPNGDMELALRIYFEALDEQARQNHTLFFKHRFTTFFPCMPRAERNQLEGRVWGVLVERSAIVWVREPQPDLIVFDDVACFALFKDWIHAKITIQSLHAIEQNAYALAEPELRGRYVPQIPPALTERQMDCAVHIQKHWLTVVEGAPGTGKTAVITWLLSHWRNVMITGFVGMLVKMIRRRNGNRAEVAHTIHHLLHVAKMAGFGKNVDEWRASDTYKWLSQFEILVIDEFSNVSMALFAKVLRIFPNVSKLVLVGDHHQLKPIESGDPMGDILATFSHAAIRLEENLRVEPRLANLQQAPSLIVSARSRSIRFGDNGGLLLSRYGTDLVSFLKTEFTRAGFMVGPSLLDCHVVVLRNISEDGRHAVNRAAEEALISLNRLHPHQGGVTAYLRGDMRIYPGCKITFTHNYNQPMYFSYHNEQRRKYTAVGDTVSNGELVIITHIKRLPDSAYLLTTVDTEHADEEPETKNILIHAKHGVHPLHVSLGYATTSYKSQGREFPYVVFIVCPSPSAQWTRSHAYVALSRGRKHVTVAVKEDPRDFYRLCDVRDWSRNTVFGRMLDSETFDTQPIDHYQPQPILLIAQMVADQNLDVPCVPVPPPKKKVE